MAHHYACGIQLTFTNDNIAIIQMRNGENRIDKRFIDAFNKALDTVERNNECRALITTGEGKFYSNGMNLDFLLKNDEDSVRNRPMMSRLMVRLLTFPLVTIAAINGHAFAGGGLLVLYQDYRVMQTKKGWISLNEIFINVPQRLTANIPLIKSKFPGRTSHELVMGRRFTAQEAKAYGIVDVVTSPETLLSSAKALANQYTLKQKYDRKELKAYKEDLYKDVIDSVNELIKSRL